MHMKKRVLSALLVLCLACGLVSTAWATEGTGTVSEPAAAAETSNVVSVDPATPESGAEETESDSQPEETVEGTETPVEGGTEYTAALESDGQTMNIFVTAPDGAFAEGVEPQLSVTMLSDEDKLDAVASELDNAQVQYDGFTALDITFTDKATGEEIEPAQDVAVRIELPQAIVDSGIDLTTLAVQHLEEDENGDVKNVTEVATLDNGITLSEEAAAAANEAAGVAPMSDLPAEEATAGDATETPAAVAEFEVDGFSSFVITWVDYEAGKANYASINVVLWDDQAGKELDAPLFNTSWTNPLQDNTTKTASDLVGDNQYITVTENGEETTYEYNNATYTVTSKESGRIDNEGDFRQIRANRSGRHGRYYAYINGSSNGIRFNDYSITVYLHYDTATITPDPGTDTPSATITAGKSAVKLDDDNYTLNLSVTGDRGNKIDKQKMDVLFILDESNSMRYDFGWINNQEVDRIAAAKYAIGEIVGAGYGHTNGLSQNTALDVEYALVGFYGGENDEGYNNSHNDATSHVTGNWTKSATTLYNSTPGSLSNRDNGGTNYEAGFYKGNELLNLNRPDREDAIKVVIFISDGVPGYYYDNTGKTTGKGQPGSYNPNRPNSDEYKAVHNAISELQKMDIDYFYFVGVGSNSINSDVYTDIVSAAAVPTTNKGSVEASSTDDLIQKFKDIQEKLTFYLADNVKMTDPLSENAELVAEANGENTGKYKFTITLEHRENADANYVALESKDVYIQLDENGTGTAQVQDWTVGSETIPSITVKVENHKTIKVEFDSKYRLAQNYRYTVSTTIAPSSSAIAAGVDGYNATGEGDQSDLKTGTHSGQSGYFSNDNNNAVITYDAITTDKDGSVTARTDGEPVYFPKPVIQVPEKTTVDLTLEKTFVGLSDAEVEYLIFRDDGFGFDVNYCVSEARPEDPEQSGKNMTFMAPDADVRGLYLPDGTEISSLNNGGGGYRIVAGNYLVQDQWHNESEGTYNTDYTNPKTGASLKKENGNWVYSITLTVPKCDQNHFFTVFEQHQEVPGYAKINDSNAEWTITGLESTPITGTGKFIEGNRNVYEDMNELGEKGNYREQEDYAIAKGALRKLSITGPTTIAFTNHYTGKLDVTKEIGDSNEYSEAEGEAYTLTIAPAHLDKLSSVQNGLKDKTVSYKIVTTDQSGNETVVPGGTGTKTLDDKGSFTIDIKPGQTIHFSDMPAIQWQVTEDEAKAKVEGYTLDVAYSDSNNSVVNDVTHWNKYVTGDTIGGSYPNDGIASVDSAVREHKNPDVNPNAVAKVTVTNVYTPNTVILTVNKTVAGSMGDTTNHSEFTFHLTLKNGDAAVTDATISYTVDNGQATTMYYDEEGQYYFFTLSHGETAVITIPYGYTATLQEVEGNGYEVYSRLRQVRGDGKLDGEITGNLTDENTETTLTAQHFSNSNQISPIEMTQDQECDFVNFRKVVAPTGLESNHTTPYVLMITAAGVAGLALIGGIVARRVRRRREE